MIIPNRNAADLQIGIGQAERTLALHSKLADRLVGNHSEFELKEKCRQLHTHTKPTYKAESLLL